jgi:hypothetical protein
MTLELRHARMWLVLGWLLVLASIVASLVPPRALPPVGVSDKFEHSLAYVVLTLWFTGIYPRSRYFNIAVGLFALGVVIEFLQGAMNLGRQRDYHDVIANCGGIAAGLIIARFGLGGWAQRVESWAYKW